MSPQTAIFRGLTSFDPGHPTLNFSCDKALVTRVTEHDAAEFVRWLRGVKQYAPATVGKRVKIAKQIFKSAIQRRIIEANPFAGQKAPRQENRDREHFVTREAVDSLLAHCPDDQWRVIIALARFGGLRCPSEILDLTWDCVNWSDSRLTVIAHKSERRVIPLFPELRPFLEESFEAAPEGCSHVVHRYRSTNANLRTQLQRIAKRAGVELWGKPFQNMRSTRDTELLRRYPIHIAAAWIGNSPEIALRHYAQLTETDQRNAALADAAQWDETGDAKSEHKSEHSNSDSGRSGA